jgi:hypothetical protein
MSVAIGTFWNLPAHRRPRLLGRGSTGPVTDRIYEVAVPFRPDLLLEVFEDLPLEHHAVVEPSGRMPFVQYESALLATRANWTPVEP